MNVLFILSDRHNPEFTGCYGNPITRTPHIDSIAERGTRFEGAYCISPLCGPTRAAIISGRYPHEIGAWSNGFLYTGIPKGWGHYFKEQGVHTTTIGKVDFHQEADHGIADTRLVRHRDRPDIHGLYREDEIVRRYTLLHRIRSIGPADSPDPYADDDEVANEAVRWLTEEIPCDRPWILNVNFLRPLPPWTPPKDLWDHYDERVRLEDLDERYFEDPTRLHPYNQTFVRHLCGDLIRPEELRRAHVGMHGTCEAMDHNVGRVLRALEQSGHTDETLVVYTSDHGGGCGEHLDWDVGGMYEASIRVPFVIAGPGVKSGAVESNPVSHHDLFQTFCKALDLEPPVHTRGDSLWGLLQDEKGATKPAFTLTQFHAGGFPASTFVVRSGSYKYVECVGERPLLFDLARDPLEMHDLVVEQPESVQVKATIRRLRGLLCGVCSPEAVDARARADQRRLRRELTENGQLAEMIWKAGYERNPDRLIPRQDLIP
jgi:choline-sulfatase